MMNKSLMSATAVFVGALPPAFLTLGGNSALADNTVSDATPSVATPMTLLNGWTNAPFGTNIAAVQKSRRGIVHLQGAIANGTCAEAFVPSAEFRPLTEAYVPVDLCAATKVQLFIQPSGVVTVQAETSFSEAQWFTSLDGATIVQ
jgi:hypothetical protein